MPALKVTPADIALVLCTSGTTGKSKGAAHSHHSLLNQLEGIQYFPFTVEKPNLLISKGTHITGCTFPLACLSSGKTCLVMAKITKENVFKAVDTYRPGFIWGFPTFLLILVNDPEAVNYDVSSLEIAASGGAPVTPAIENTLMKLPNLKVVINVSVVVRKWILLLYVAFIILQLHAFHVVPLHCALCIIVVLRVNGSCSHFV